MHLTLHRIVRFKFLKKEVQELKTNDSSNSDIAVRYLGRALIAVIICGTIFGLASLGYNSYINFTKKGIEVNAHNFNSSKLNEIE